MRRSGSGSPPSGRGGKKPAEVSVIPGKKPATTEVEQTAVAGKPVAAEVERAAASDRPLAAEVRRAATSERPVTAELGRVATNENPVAADVERAAAGERALAAELERTAAGQKALAAEVERASAVAKPVAAKVERASGGEKPAVAEGWERLARELWDPKVQSKFWLEVFSLATDAWLRSGAFLEFMQYGLQAAIGESSRDRGSMNSGAQPFGEVGGTPRDPAASRKDKKS
jgi:hypothetical protein